MSDSERHWREVRQKKYQDLYGNENYIRSGGIFGFKKRKQLLGVIEKSEGTCIKEEDEKTTFYNFWYKIRKTVKTTLIDLQLFIETANKKDVNLVLDKDTVQNFLTTLLYHPKEDAMNVKIAQMLAEQGLSYLRYKSQYITQAQINSIDETILMTKQLTIMELPENERIQYYIDKKDLR